MRERQGYDLSLGKDVEIGEGVTIGRYTSLGDHSSAKRCSIGSFCSIANRVAINPWNHPTDWLSTHEFQFRDDSYGTEEYRAITKMARPNLYRLTIGHDVWIGVGAVILADVSNGAVVGANAVVTRPVSSYEKVAGAPAKHIGWRYRRGVRQVLDNLRWWDLPLSMLNDMPYDDVHTCIRILEKRKRCQSQS